MQNVLLALAIMSALKQLRSGGELNLESLVPMVGMFFGKDKLSPEELAVYTQLFKEFVALIRE